MGTAWVTEPISIPPILKDSPYSHSQRQYQPESRCWHWAHSLPRDHHKQKLQSMTRAHLRGEAPFCRTQPHSNDKGFWILPLPAGTSFERHNTATTEHGVGRKCVMCGSHWTLFTIFRGMFSDTNTASLQKIKVKRFKTKTHAHGINKKEGRLLALPGNTILHPLPIQASS